MREGKFKIVSTELLNRKVTTKTSKLPLGLDVDRCHPHPHRQMPIKFSSIKKKNSQVFASENRKKKKKGSKANKLTSLTALYAESRDVKVTNAYPRLVPVIGSIMRRRSQIEPHFSNRGISSSSYMSFGIFPQNTSQPLPGGANSQFGGGPPYFRWPRKKV